MITIVLLLLIFILFVYNYVHYERKRRLINNIPGPHFYPIVGHILMYYKYFNSREKLWNILHSWSDEYYPIYRFWLLSVPIVIIRHPDDLQVILSSMEHTEKSFFYHVFRPWLGTTFFLNGETTMDVSIRDHGTFQKQYLNAFHQLIKFLPDRLLTSWLYNNGIFSLTPQSREQRKLLKILHGLSEQIIAERKLYHERTNNQFLQNFCNNTSAKDDDAELTKVSKKRLGLLDLLIAASRDGLITDKNIRDEVDNFLFAGHHTITVALSFILALLAEHKDIQDRIRDEIDSSLQKNEQECNIKLLQSLPYLERCIKESLRLYPSVSLISRKVTEDLYLQSYLIPAGTVFVLNIYEVHRDPNFWPNPEVFDPDRFLPEKTQKHHPYSYLPFSAGPRNCLGQRYAMLEMKAIIASLLHDFYLEPVDYLKSFKPHVDFVNYPHLPLRIKFVPICKRNKNT